MLYGYRKFVYIKIDDIYKDFTEKCWNLVWYCKLEKIKKVIELIEDELGGKIIIKFVWLTSRTHSYFIDDASVDKKEKGTKKCVTKKLGY